MQKHYLSVACFSSLSGDEYAHTVHGFEVKICASMPSSVEAIGAGSSKVFCFCVLGSYYCQL